MQARHPEHYQKDPAQYFLFYVHYHDPNVSNELIVYSASIDTLIIPASQVLIQASYRSFLAWCLAREIISSQMTVFLDLCCLGDYAHAFECECNL